MRFIIKDKKKQRKMIKDWWLKNKDTKEFKEKRRVFVRNWNRKNPLKVRQYNFKRKYNITLEQYEKRLEDQKQKCANPNCNNIHDEQGGRVGCLAIDHDHKTGLIRGLLCRDCNLVLGHCKDDELVLKGLVAYLRSKE